MAAGDEAALLIGCRMAMIAVIWMSFEREQACVSNPRRRSSSCIIGLVKVSLKAMDNGKKENDEHGI